MARGRRKKETVEKAIRLKQSELKQAIADASRHKVEASKWSGMHGQGVKLFCERTSFDKTVFGWLRKLHDMNDPLKVQSVVRQFLMGIELLDWNKQGDLFDVTDDIASKAERDDGEDDEGDDVDVRPPFMRNAMPLHEAEAAFTKTEHLAPQPDALSALAGEDSGVGAATKEAITEAEVVEVPPATVEVTKSGRRQRVPRAEVEAASKAGRAEVRGIGDVVLN